MSTWEERKARYEASVKAHSAVLKAVRNGKLDPIKSLRCADCGETAEHYHHNKGYEPENQLKVVPLCRACHRRRHLSPREVDELQYELWADGLYRQELLNGEGCHICGVWGAPLADVWIPPFPRHRSWAPTKYLRICASCGSRFHSYEYHHHGYDYYAPSPTPTAPPAGEGAG